MPNNLPPIEIELSPRFKRDLRILAKRYRHIRSDLESLIAQLQAGQLPGDRVSGTGYTLYKVRLKNSDIPKGKSAGYRVVYYLKTSDLIILVTMYSKSDRTDVDLETIKTAIFQYEQDLNSRNTNNDQLT